MFLINTAFDMSNTHFFKYNQSIHILQDYISMTFYEKLK